MSIVPNLLINNSKLVLKSHLVKISTICCVEGTKGMQIAPQSFFSFIKCLSISTCFMRSCCTGFYAILIAVLLSQYNFIGICIGIQSSSRIFSNQRISQTPLAIALYFASTLLLVTTFRVLLHHVTRFPQT